MIIEKETDFKWKKLSTNYPQDFEQVLDTLDHTEFARTKFFALSVPELGGNTINFQKI